MAGSITTEDREFVETWEHISQGRWGVTRLNPRGDEVAEVIHGRTQFRLTTEERIISQDKIRKPALDPFLNGAFRPVVVPDSVTIETNPNALSDEEIQKILTSSPVAFEEWVKTIDSVATITRMLELGEDSEDLPHKRFMALQERLTEVRGVVRIESSDPALQKFLSDRPSLSEESGRTALSGQSNPRRRVGGMSADYR